MAMYDYPYRLEYSPTAGTYDVVRTGEGVIASGENVSELRRLVEMANEMMAIEQGDRGR
jgi:hypothetical protein